MNRLLLIASTTATILLSSSAQADKTPEKILNRLDTDGDGQVSVDEWLKPRGAFDRIDSDGDGMLTYEELQAFLADKRKEDRTLAKQGSVVEWIDVHVHPVTGRRQRPNAKGTVAAAVAVMDANHISKMVLMPQPMIDFKEQGNSRPPVPIERWIKEARKYPDRFEVMGGGGSLNAMIHDESPNGHPSDKLKRRFAKRAKEILELGAVGFGELAVSHLKMVPGQPIMDVPADHPLLLMLVDIAAEHDVVIDVHFDPVLKDIPRPDYLPVDNPAVLKRNIDAFERFLAHNRNARISWAHVGSDRLSFWTPKFTRDMLARHSNLYMSLRMFPGMSGLNHPLDANGIKAEWMKTFQEFPDRFFIGGDQFFVSPALRNQKGPAVTFARNSQNTREQTNRFLSYLPPDIANKIAYENAWRIYKVTSNSR